MTQETMDYEDERIPLYRVHWTCVPCGDWVETYDVDVYPPLPTRRALCSTCQQTTTQTSEVRKNYP